MRIFPGQFFPNRRDWSDRARAISLFFATSIAARAVGVVCQLWQVPIALRLLGPEGFGLWMAVVSLSYVVAFADCGMGQGAQNQLAEAFAAGDFKRARELWSCALLFLGGVGLLLGIAAWAIAPRLDFTALFHLTSPAAQAEAPAAVTVALVLFCLNFPLGLAQRLAYSRQLGWMHNVAQAGGAALSLGGIFLAAHLHWGLAGVIAITQAGPLAAFAGLIGVQLLDLGWLRAEPAARTHRREAWLRRKSVLRGLLGLGAYFGIQQVLLTLLISLPPIILSTSLGAAAVTPYNLGQRLFNLFAIVQNAFMLPLWPAYAAARVRGEHAWIRRTLFRSLAATALATIAPMAVGAVFARPAVGWWLGSATALPTTRLIWLLFFWNAAIFLQQPFGYLLAGLSEVRRLTGWAAVSAAGCAGLACLLVRRGGAEGVMLGMVAGYLPFLCFGNIAETVRVLRRDGAPPNPSPPLLAEPAEAKS
jgi:O-antigen/teichoic acid export membrane protein